MNVLVLHEQCHIELKLSWVTWMTPSRKGWYTRSYNPRKLSSPVGCFHAGKKQIWVNFEMSGLMRANREAYLMGYIYYTGAIWTRKLLLCNKLSKKSTTADKHQLATFRHQMVISTADKYQQIWNGKYYSFTFYGKLLASVDATPPKYQMSIFQG